MERIKTDISIFTLNGYFNYGNRLQLFALNKVISNMSYEAVINWRKTIPKKIVHFLKTKTLLKFYYKKEARLYSFTKERIGEEKNTTNYRLAIVGSDQVWNPGFITAYNNMPIKNPNNRIVSYAASMGVEELTPKQIDYYKIMLEDYSAISVREQSAKKLLQPLTNKKIEVVLDPTLLLDKSEYEALEKKPKKLAEDEKYVLCYILGNRDHEAAIEKFAKEKGYRTIYFSDKRDSSYGIEEFLYLIHHAQLICTDSFHACVFSFIFERPFAAFRRTGKENYMYTRLQNLIDTFKLKNREFNGKEITKDNLEVDYTEAKKILKKEQKKSLDFLKGALK